MKNVWPPSQDMPSLSQHKLTLSLSLWRSGKDTMQIATQLGVPEAAVYNSLANTRRARRNVDGRAGGNTEETAC
jgi:hypothetical protein